MQRSKLFRTILILFFIVLALVYLYPTFRTQVLNRELDARLDAISSKSGLERELLAEAVFRFDIDLANRISTMEELEPGVREELIEEVQALRGDFYDKLSDVRSGAIKLGLDLQGGMHLVLEVNLVELMDRLAKNRDVTFDQITENVRTRLDENPTLSFESVMLDEFERREIPMARYFGDPRQSDREILRMLRRQAEEAINLTLTKLRNRVDEFGVSEPSITRQGSRRIIVELPGVQDPARARNLIGRTALLEFQLVADPKVTAKVIRDIDDYLVESRGSEDSEVFEAVAAAPEPKTVEVDTTLSPLQRMLTGAGEEEEEQPASDTVGSFIDADHPFTSLLSLYDRQIMVNVRDRTAVERYLGRTDILKLIPPDYEFLWSHSSDETSDGSFEFWNLYLLKKRAEITGAALADAQVIIGSGSSDPTQAGAPIVNISMKRDGARRFARITEANVGEHLAIVLDSKVHMAPVIRTRIPNGQATIEGSESVEAANDLAIVLRAGALPAPVEIIEERTVGPSLGADSIRAGATSALTGLALVMFFMAVYYRGSGLVADLVLLLNLVFLLAVLAGFGFTLTLPGIAGIILTIGIAVDANVLIFERIREELDTGKTIWNAIKAGYGRAFVTIMDANVTTLIAGIVLYQFGTGPIRGFALTLMIGIVASMFTALVVSRAIFDWITTTWTVKKLSI